MNPINLKSIYLIGTIRKIKIYDSSLILNFKLQLNFSKNTNNFCYLLEKKELRRIDDYGNSEPEFSEEEETNYEEEENIPID